MPKVTVITRKAFGGAYDVMASKHLRRRHQLCLADGADRRDGRQGRGRDHLSARTSAIADKIAAHTKDYEDRFLSPFVAAERGYVDEVIMPHSTRRRDRAGARDAAQQGTREPLEEARQHSPSKGTANARHLMQASLYAHR